MGEPTVLERLSSAGSFYKELLFHAWNTIGGGIVARRGVITFRKILYLYFFFQSSGAWPSSTQCNSWIIYDKLYVEHVFVVSAMGAPPRSCWNLFVLSRSWNQRHKKQAVLTGSDQRTHCMQSILLVRRGQPWAATDSIFERFWYNSLTWSYLFVGVLSRGRVHLPAEPLA